MVTARIDFKKINEKKDLSYLDHWCCPLEIARKSGSDAVIGKQSPFTSLHLIPSLSLSKILLNLPQKRAMAGF